MMRLKFYKYQGTGNDFILLDNRRKEIELSRSQIAFLCDRRFGIGADGLMLLETAAGLDFRMVYFNSDGAESSMCGNGGRCLVAFARSLGIGGERLSFVAIDGRHEAMVGQDGTVELHMQDVKDIRHFGDYALLDTGSPHYVQWLQEDVAGVDVEGTGRRIRNDPRFAPGGLNVNFTRRLSEGLLDVRTYERGVEAETLSCGTGVTAAAIASSGEALGSFRVEIRTPGGSLGVDFTKDAPDAASHVVLRGPARLVFEGLIELPE